MALVVIDEIDALVHKQTTGGPLHRLFEWASLPNSNLVLIGIANGVNLISKFFPRLRALRCGRCGRCSGGRALPRAEPHAESSVAAAHRETGAHAAP